AMYLPARTPMDLRILQWVDFQTSYQEGLRQLVQALSRFKVPTPPQLPPGSQPQVARFESTLAPSFQAPPARISAGPGEIMCLVCETPTMANKQFCLNCGASLSAQNAPAPGLGDPFGGPPGFGWPTGSPSPAPSPQPWPSQPQSQPEPW